MTLEISDNILAKSQMTEQEILLELALTLFEKKRLTRAQACDLARIDIAYFDNKLAQQHNIKPNTIWEPVSLNIEKFPKNLDAFAVDKKQLDALSSLFEDEPSAEELCKML